MVRISFDDPSGRCPTESLHWKSLFHEEGDAVLRNLDELRDRFLRDLRRNDDDDEGPELSLPLWSCVVGYCEALSTHRDPARRFSLYPIPIDALRRLVATEFVEAFVKDVVPNDDDDDDDSHRAAARAVADVVWKRTTSKPNVRDELHANSVYTVLRGGEIDGKSLDCFGSVVATVSALRAAGRDSSLLTLSEDHAYESHRRRRRRDAVDDDADAEPLDTCELAVPGNTKEARAKRGRPIEATFEDDRRRGDAVAKRRRRRRRRTISAATSWLYMGAAPVICRTVPAAIAAVVANVNCSVSSSSSSNALVSARLFDAKREMLWALKDEGHLDAFPFGLLELGDCEEHRPSARGDAPVHDPDLGADVLTVEALYREAISISARSYGDGQVYPYCYAGHYHKDAGRRGGPRNEYRLVEALRCYAEATRVASSYVYDREDCAQLVKVATALARRIHNDVLTVDDDDDDDDRSRRQRRSSRTWSRREDAVAAGAWLLGFHDSLLAWEEENDGDRFVEIYSNPTSDWSLGRSFRHFSHDVRREVLSRLHDDPPAANDDARTNVGENDGVAGAVVLRPDKRSSGATESYLPYFHRPRSARLRRGSALVSALGKAKVSVGETELTIPVGADDDDDEHDGGGVSTRRGGRRTSKRTRAS